MYNKDFSPSGTYVQSKQSLEVLIRGEAGGLGELGEGQGEPLEGFEVHAGVCSHHFCIQVQELGDYSQSTCFCRSRKGKGRAIARLVASNS